MNYAQLSNGSCFRLDKLTIKGLIKSKGKRFKIITLSEDKL